MAYLTWISRALILGVALGALTLHSGGAEAADNVTLITDSGQRTACLLLLCARERLLQGRRHRYPRSARGQGSADAVKQVAAGTAQLGFADTSAVIFGRAKRRDSPVKLVAVIYARPPHAIYVLKELGI